MLASFTITTDYLEDGDCDEITQREMKVKVSEPVKEEETRHDSV